MAITGTNLLAPTLTGGEVRFNPYGPSEVAIHTVPDAGSPTSLRVIVPATAAVGPFRVMIFAATGETVFSAVSFAGPCHGDPGVHSRSVTLRLRAPRRSRGGQRRRWVRRLRGARSNQGTAARGGGMEDRKDDHYEPHRFLQEAHPRQGRQVPGQSPAD